MNLIVTHSQIAVFDPRLENPFNDWREAHVRQGFSWRPGSVSFSTLGDGDIVVTTDLGGARRADARRSIRVPFSVRSARGVEIATIATAARSCLFELDPGHYSLTFEHGFTPGGEMWCRFIWEPATTAVEPAILVADPDFEVPHQLVMEAEPAI